ncbi:uncharacterized mitochondrial protein-like protein [Tanacetum coccineum]|uniref:Uncharacterized mitochondrial protein-like protein n=1 Tax=Tanacetum coccineum TaxID=301880 RepID=A0ABQ4X7A3_9ASTR
MEGVMTEMPITTAKEKAQRRLEVKARSTLMMGILNEHQLKFNSIKDAKKLLEAVVKRFGGNADTRKTQRNLLKQQYENITATNSEMLDQNMIASKLAVHLGAYGMKSFPQEDYDIEEIDLRWQMAMLTMKGQEFLRNTRKRKLTINGNETNGFDKSKVNAQNCHKRDRNWLGGNFMPPTPDLSFTRLDEFVNELVVENCKAMSSEEEPKVVRKYNDAPNQQVIDSGCSRHMTGNMSYLTDYEEIDGGYVAFGGNSKGGKITGKDIIKTGTKASDNAGQSRKETEPVKDYILLPLWTADLPYSQDTKSSHDDGSKPSSDDGKNVDEDPRKDSSKRLMLLGKTRIELPFDPNMHALEDVSIFDFTRDDEDDGVEEPKKVIHALKDPSWIECYAEEIEEEVYVCRPPRFEDPNFPDRVYKVEKALYRLHQAPRAWFIEVKTASTLIETQKPLLKDEDGEEVDVHMYRSMIGSLMYLTSSRPDIMFAVCACARYQVNSKVSHLHAVKRIFSDYAGASLNKKSTTGGCQFLGCRLISWQCKKQTVLSNSITDPEYVAALSCCGQAKTINGEVQLHALVDGKKIIIIESTVRRDLQLEDAEGIDCLPNSTIFDELTRMGSKTTAWNEFSSTMASAIICLATNQKFNFSKYIFESMVRNLDNLSGKFLCIQDIWKYEKGRQKIFWKSDRFVSNYAGSKPNGRRKPKRKDTQVPQPSGPTDIIADEAVHKELGDSLVRAATTASSLEAEQDSGNITKTRSKATPNESSSLGTTSGGGPRCQETMGDTIAQTRFENVSKHSNDSLLARGNTLRSDEDRLKLEELMALCTNLQNRVLDLEKTKTTQHNEIASLKRRVKKLEKKNRSRTHKLKRLYKVGLTARVESSGDEESLGEDASKQGRINAIDADEEITLVSVQDDADKGFDIHAQKIDVDHQLAERLQAQEQEELSIEEKATLFEQLLEKRRKHFAAKRAEEKRNKPPTKAQQRNIICTYLKNMEGYKLNDLKLKEFDSIQEMFDRGKENRAGPELAQEITKKQKVEDDKETAEIKKLMEIIPDEEEVAIDAIHLAVKSLSIVDWKIHKEGRKSYYQIIRADVKSQMYMLFSQMLKSFDRGDLEDLYKLVKAKYKSKDLTWKDFGFVIIGLRFVTAFCLIEDPLYSKSKRYAAQISTNLAFCLEVIAFCLKD